MRTRKRARTHTRTHTHDTRTHIRTHTLHTHTHTRAHTHTHTTRYFMSCFRKLRKSIIQYIMRIKLPITVFLFRQTCFRLTLDTLTRTKVYEMDSDGISENFDRRQESNRELCWALTV